jgi:hypothetical protein
VRYATTLSSDDTLEIFVDISVHLRGIYRSKTCVLSGRQDDWIDF